MMEPDQIRICVEEAKRFLVRARAVLAAVQKRKMHDGTPYEYLDSGKLTGALRRASMDLTRSLADLRRSR